MISQGIGELFMLGFQGPTVPGWLREFATRFGLGGVILFDYDYQAKTYDNNIQSPEQVRKLCAELSALPSHPLILVDQEGGKVRRLKEKLGFAPLPSAQAFAAMPLSERELLLRNSFREMRSLGFHFDLAPVVDLNLNPRNPDIGAVERSYSADLSIVRENARLVDKIARETKLGLCLKHYPGLGSATTNSHLSLTDVTATLTEAEEEIFYELGAEVYGGAILLSHAFVRQWDQENPVSLSLSAVARLRSRLPDALLLTDDLQMQGLQQICHTREGCRRALHAGIDWLVIGNNLLREEKELAGIAEDLARDPSLTKAIETAIARIRRRKQLFA